MCHFSKTTCFGFVFMLAEGNDQSSLTNNMQALYIMKQSWCVCEKVGSTVKAMQLRIHIRCVQLKSGAAQTDQCLTSKYLESILKA